MARGSCDNWNFNSSNPCVYAGGYYNQNRNYGLFYLNYNSTSNTNTNRGCRLGLKAKISPDLARTAAHPLVKISDWERASTPERAMETPVQLKGE